jgi:hypothetical protein
LPIVGLGRGEETEDDGQGDNGDDRMRVPEIEDRRCVSKRKHRKLDSRS